MGSSDPATYDALSTESVVVVPLGSCWSGALMTGAAVQVGGIGPTTSRHRRDDSYTGAELAR
jgi:hypothetical protein